MEALPGRRSFECSLQTYGAADHCTLPSSTTVLTDHQRQGIQKMGALGWVVKNLRGGGQFQYHVGQRNISKGDNYEISSSVCPSCRCLFHQQETSSVPVNT